MSELIDNIKVIEQLTQELRRQEIGLTGTELHGFLTGILAGGNNDESWQPLLYDMTNEGQAFSGQLATLTKQLYQITKQQLESDEFDFQLILTEDNLFTKIDDLINWVNYFLLGLGLVQPQLTKVKGDVGEAINDLREIVKLGYDEDDDQEELALAFEEVFEYVRVAVMLCHDEFSNKHATPTLH